MATSNYIKIGNEYFAPNTKEAKAYLGGRESGEARHAAPDAQPAPAENPKWGCPTKTAGLGINKGGRPTKRILNKLETRYRNILVALRFKPLEQKITLELDSPYKSYRPDLAYVHHIDGLTFVEVKGPHRFREKGIAKAALAAKTYPMFKFVLVEPKQNGWDETTLSS